MKWNNFRIIKSICNSTAGEVDLFFLIFFFFLNIAAVVFKLKIKKSNVIHEFLLKKPVPHLKLLKTAVSTKPYSILV